MIVDATAVLICPAYPSCLDTCLILADRFGRPDIFLDVLDRSQLKLLTVVESTITKLASTPGAITGYPDQQRTTSTFAGRSDSTDFKGICA
jgi:hypothetical protein